jgi:hypothetical protein
MSAVVPFPSAPESARPTAGRRNVASARPVPVTGAQRFRLIWFGALLASICFEGLGRRLLPMLPAMAFYFLKDIVLLIGLIRFRINREVMATFKYLYRGFLPFLKMGILWTAAEMFNPSQLSLPLGLVGLRAYWLWWLAPFVVASVFADAGVRRRAVLIMAYVAIAVALFAFLQFGAPSDSAVNVSAIVEGEEVHAVAIESTGRARVASTFSFVSGFADFSVLVPALLLSLGLGEKNKRERLAVLIATLLSAAALPMSGSRAPFVLSMALCVLVAWRAGLVFTAAGRRIMMLGVGAGLMMVFAFPDAIQGVMDRFASEDTEARFEQLTSLIPPIPLTTADYPLMGLGTGMQQAFRLRFGVPAGKYLSEVEFIRYLVEVGALGYLLVWLARLGLVVALWRASKVLKKAGRRAAAGAAVSYALLTFFGSPTFDHIFSALYFLGFGFILHEAVHAWPIAYGRTILGKSARPQLPARANDSD